MLSKELSNNKLTYDVSVNGEIVEVEVVDVSHIDVVIWRVFPCDASELDIFRTTHVNETRSTRWVVDNVLSHPPHKALSINLTSSHDLKVVGVVELHEIAQGLIPLSRDWVILSSNWESSVALRDLDLAINSQYDVCESINTN